MSSSSTLSSGATAVASVGAGVVTTLVANPLSVVRTRMVMVPNNDRKYASIRQTFKHIYCTEGIRGMYKVSTSDTKLSFTIVHYIRDLRRKGLRLLT
jgi:hypothetical protein